MGNTDIVEDGKFNGQDFKVIREELLKGHTLFVDEEFPPSEKSLL